MLIFQREGYQSATGFLWALFIQNHRSSWCQRLSRLPSPASLAKRSLLPRPPPVWHALPRGLGGARRRAWCGCGWDSFQVMPVTGPQTTGMFEDVKKAAKVAKPERSIWSFLDGSRFFRSMEWSWTGLAWSNASSGRGFAGFLSFLWQAFWQKTHADHGPWALIHLNLLIGLCCDHGGMSTPPVWNRAQRQGRRSITRFTGGGHLPGRRDVAVANDRRLARRLPCICRWANEGDLVGLNVDKGLDYVCF